ncbi:hypothetical protein BGX28_003707 [Mortierella sp. GBA30]|nr:hypothetical protein BGX28_003707 [Mortierella sp. GBA30]
MGLLKEVLLTILPWSIIECVPLALATTIYEIEIIGYLFFNGKKRPISPRDSLDSVSFLPWTMPETAKSWQGVLAGWFCGVIWFCSEFVLDIALIFLSSGEELKALEAERIQRKAKRSSSAATAGQHKEQAQNRGQKASQGNSSNQQVESRSQNQLKENQSRQAQEQEQLQEKETAKQDTSVASTTVSDGTTVGQAAVHKETVMPDLTLAPEEAVPEERSAPVLVCKQAEHGPHDNDGQDQARGSDQDQLTQFEQLCHRHHDIGEKATVDTRMDKDGNNLQLSTAYCEVEKQSWYNPAGRSEAACEQNLEEACIIVKDETDATDPAHNSDDYKRTTSSDKASCGPTTTRTTETSPRSSRHRSMASSTSDPLPRLMVPLSKAVQLVQPRPIEYHHSASTDQAPSPSSPNSGEHSDTMSPEKTKKKKRNNKKKSKKKTSAPSSPTTEGRGRSSSVSSADESWNPSTATESSPEGKAHGDREIVSTNDNGDLEMAFENISVPLQQRDRKRGPQQ